MPVYFVDDEAVHPPQIRIHGRLARHLARSLRMQPGEECHFIDPSEQRYVATLTTVTPSTVIATILRKESASTDSRTIILAQALLKGQRMDWMLQKAAELGVSRIVPLITDRTIVQPRRERLATQLQRWRAILRDAAQQSGRTRLPELDEPTDLASSLQQMTPDLSRLILWEREQREFLAQYLLALPPERPLALFIGPEGGFSPDEVSACLAQGVHPVSLGPLVLRAETATLAALAVIQACTSLSPLHSSHRAQRVTHD